MSNPSDPHRHHGDDLPRDTDAFEDTEFSMGTKDATDATAGADGASTGAPAGSSGNLEGAEGYDAEVDSSGDTHDTTGPDGDREVIDAESTEVTDDGEPLGSARDPEVTGIIPIVDDDRISEHEQKLSESNESNESTATTVIPTAGASAPADGAAPASTPATGGGGDSDGPPPGNGSRPWFARFPTWGWILVIGLGLSVIGAATAVALMRTGDGEERHSPYSSVVPNYPRPEAWDSNKSIPTAEPDNSAGSDYYEPEYNEPEEYTPSTPEESEESTPSSQAPAPSEQNPGNGGDSGNPGNNGNGGNNGGGNGNNGGGNQTTPGGGTGGDGNNGGGNGNGGNTGGNTGGTDDGTDGGGGDTGTGTGEGDGATGE